MVAGVGLALLPRTRYLFEFSERDLSAFSPVADTGAFAGWALACIVAGILAVIVSFLVRGD